LRATLVARLALERDPSSATAQAALLDVVPVYEALVSRWEATRPREGGFGFLRYTRARDILGEVVRLQLLAEAGEEGVTRALSQVIRAQGSGSLTRQLGRTTARVSEIRELLTEGECLLVVLPCSRTSTLFLVSHRDVLAFELPPRDRIADALRDFLRSFLGPDGATESARARAVVLTDALLPDAVRPHLLLHPRLTVVGLDLLGYVPFECLILDDGVPLGLGKEIAYLPSIPAGLALLERAARHPGPPPERDALFVVAPLPGEKIRERFPSLVRLPWDGSLARRLASAYGSAEILTDGAATLDGLAAALGVPSRVLQILSHGVQLPEQEIPAALVLGSTDRDDGLLGAAELRRLVMPPFVLLTACSAGAGPSRPGDAGSSDLGGVLLARGAQAVILPRTDLDFADAIDLSAMVHEAIATGETPAAALLRARQELDRRGSLEYPYSLSLLHVHGLGHIPVFPEGRVEGSSPVLLAVLAALAALVLVPVLILRRRVSASRG
jgi:hypothetical protein